MEALASILALVLLACHAAAFWAWCYFTQREASLNAKDILANGSADDLRKGYHSRRTWARFWPWLCLSVAGGLPFSLGGGVGGGVVASLSLGILLAAYFARFFTPALNLARGLEEFYASADSASWPDAAIWRKLRADLLLAGASASPQSQALFARSDLQELLTRVWLWGRLVYAAGLLASLLLFSHY